MKTIQMVIITAFFGVSNPVFAQHSGHNMPNPSPSVTKNIMGETPSTKDFKRANETMHKDMDIPYTGNADIDFIKGMIPHHQGAIDMARIVLAHGKDPQTRKLAETIIAAQEKEIILGLA